MLVEMLYFVHTSLPFAISLTFSIPCQLLLVPCGDLDAPDNVCMASNNINEGLSICPNCGIADSLYISKLGGAANIIDYSHAPVASSQPSFCGQWNCWPMVCRLPSYMY